MATFEGARGHEVHIAATRRTTDEPEPESAVADDDDHIAQFLFPVALLAAQFFFRVERHFGSYDENFLAKSACVRIRGVRKGIVLPSIVVCTRQCV